MRFNLSFILLFLTTAGNLFSQSLSTLRFKKLPLGADTIRIDSLSLQPGSVKFLSGHADTSLYRIDPLGSRLIKKNVGITSSNDSVAIQYRVFPLNFTETVRNKKRTYSTAEERGIYNPFVFTPTRTDNNALKFEGLNKSGSISRGISIGNNQDLAVNSTLNLQLSGKLSSDIDISAAITDDNIPIQPDGNTQQLQDFDRVYIQLSNATSKLIVGDFQITRPESYFMNFNKRLQGGSFSTQFKTPILNEAKHKPAIVKIGGSAAVARGRFNRMNIEGIEGNQGPYRLRGTNNEQFIIVLSGSEKVYIDGRLLKRGQENEYVIDYNSAEVTFTSRILMTKDLRIFVEFEYSDRNYARSLLYFNNEIEQGKLTTRINIYSEQDSKNQPLQQQLTAEQKDVLAAAGDNVTGALIESIDSVEFSTDLILYRKADTTINTIIYQDILIYSTNPASAKFRATFTNVGPKNGNYIQANSAANGRVFQWVAPIDGVKQGTFEPKSLLIPPSKKQVVTFGTTYRMNARTKIVSEVAYSNADLNTFSPINSENDQAYALKVSGENIRKFGNDTALLWTLTSTLSYEQVDKNFSPIERFRNVEFDRDWNIQRTNAKPATEYLPRLNINVGQGKTGTINYLFTSYIRGEEFAATQHAVATDLKKRGFGLIYNGSLTQSKGDDNNSFFYRHRTLFTKNIKWVQVGYKDEFERNLIKDPATDTLRAVSYTFFDRQAFIQNLDTAKRKFNLFYKVRTDDGVRSNDLKEYAWAESYGFSMDFSANENAQLRTITSYRNLKIRDTLLSTLKPEQTLVNRIELNLRRWKSSVVSTTFYEVGSGLETRKEFSYLEVQPGQGVYSWTDYNGNGILELNEFEIAAFPDQARYIRVFTPTQDFIRVYSSQFNQTLNLKAPNEWSNKKGGRKFVSRFSTQSALRVEGRTQNNNLLVAYNPLGSGVNDPELVTLNQTLRNSVFFNRNDPKFGFDLNWQQLATKALLNNGFESRENNFANYRLRWSPGTRFTINAETKNGSKTSTVEYFSSRDYDIKYFELEPKFSYQPNATFRLTLSYKRSVKNNRDDLGGEKALSDNAGFDLKYNVPNKGSLQTKFNVILISFDGNQNSPVAFEMQEGLRTGQNYTWGLSYQRTLSNNMQLSFNYDGRKSPDVKAVHVGGVQVRVFF